MEVWQVQQRSLRHQTVRPCLLGEPTRLSVEKAPEVCVVHLKRFERQRGGKRNARSNSPQKLTSHVAFDTT